MRSDVTGPGAAMLVAVSIHVRSISPDDHLEFINSRDSASFLQTPAWAQAKPEWRGESIGFFDGSTLVGAGLVLYRQLPKLRRYLAYLPEGPELDWGRSDIEDHLVALVAYAKRNKAFAVRIGPWLTHRVWYTNTVKDAIANDTITRLSDVAPDETRLVATRTIRLLQHLGWKAPRDGEGFAAGQPQFNFQLLLRNHDGSQKTEDEILRGMNQQWRRNIKKAAKADVKVTLGERKDLARFHQVYLETAERDEFTGRSLGYFETMWDALRAEDPQRMKLYLAEHDGDLVAATTMVQVGEHAWYSYGASSNAKRDVRGSNAIQWQMIRDANDAGCAIYDMRGIVEHVGSEHPEIGLIQFKVGTGGQAIAHVGEWDKPINSLLYFAFDQYLRRR